MSPSAIQMHALQPACCFQLMAALPVCHISLVTMQAWLVTILTCLRTAPGCMLRLPQSTVLMLGTEHMATCMDPTPPQGHADTRMCCLRKPRRTCSQLLQVACLGPCFIPLSHLRTPSHLKATSHHFPPRHHLTPLSTQTRVMLSMLTLADVLQWKPELHLLAAAVQDLLPTQA